MENIKHTPGEWMIESDSPLESTIKTKEGVRIAEVKSFTGMGFNDPTPTEREANAKLIAAAPDMLEGLQHIFNYTKGKPIGSAEYQIHMLCYSLINKATE